jgi:hypothetical protein
LNSEWILFEDDGDMQTNFRNGLHISKEENIVHSSDHGSANVFFPNYNITNLMTVQTNFLTLMALIFLTGQQDLTVVLCLTFKCILNADISVASYSPLSAVE